MKPIKGAWLLLCLVFATGVVRAQGVGASGDITGTISDPSGARIAKATILAVEIDKGIQHATETDTSGEYRLAGVPPATSNRNGKPDDPMSTTRTRRRGTMPKILQTSAELSDERPARAQTRPLRIGGQTVR